MLIWHLYDDNGNIIIEKKGKRKGLPAIDTKKTDTEQTQIAEYLDWKVSQINRIIKMINGKATHAGEVFHTIFT